MSDNAQTLAVGRPKPLTDVADFLRSFDLTQTGDRSFVSTPFERERNVIEGSHILGQAVVASSRLVGQRALSVYGTFSRAAAWDEPAQFEVDVIHKGRSFSTASVAVSQGGKRMSSATILLGANAPDLVRQQAVMPPVPDPESCPPTDQSIGGREIRSALIAPPPGDAPPPDFHVWLRLQDIPDDPVLRQAMLMELMGGNTLSAAMRPHGLDLGQAHVSLSTGVLGLNASLYEDTDFSDWLLYTSTAIYAGGGIAQVDGRIFERDGRLVASSATTCMLRRMDVDAASHGGKARVM